MIHKHSYRPTQIQDMFNNYPSKYLYTITDFAKMLGVSRQTIYNQFPEMVGKPLSRFEIEAVLRKR